MEINNPKKVLILTPLNDLSIKKIYKYASSCLKLTCPFDLYFVDPLKKIFKDVLPYDFQKRIVEIGIKKMNEEVLEIVKNYKSDYVIYLSGYYEFTIETLKKIREKSTLIGWFFDDEFRFENYTKYWIPYFDFYVTHSIEAIEKYKKLNVKVIHTLPCDGIPSYPEWDKIEKIYDVSFIGFKTEDREKYINFLKNNLKIDLFLAGHGWGKYLSFIEMNEVFRKSKINLCFTKTFNNKKQWKGRIFEVMLQGGFMLTEYVPHLEKYFEIGKEIDCFDNEKELIDKVKYYLKNEKERLEIAKRGWKKCIENYTPYHRMYNVFKEIEKEQHQKFWPQNYNKPRLELRKNYSEYYTYMAKAFILSGYKKFGLEALILAHKNLPLNFKIYLYYVLLPIPHSFYSYLFNVYKKLKKILKIFKIKK
ncbi:MAG: glycosyltransferase [bacterium]|nr:glycosyltransferase [bacterium]